MARNLEALIRERAHAIWEREGRPEGEAEAHWIQAREELRRPRRLPGWGPEHSCARMAPARRRDWVVLPRRRSAGPKRGADLAP
jgi:hypothetical protein